MRPDSPAKFIRVYACLRLLVVPEDRDAIVSTGSRSAQSGANPG